MNLVDVNVLIYAVDSDSPHHARSRKWLESALSSDETIGFAWTVILAFVRVTTRRGIMHKPLEVSDAIQYVDSWLEQPNVEIVESGEEHWSILRSLLTSTGVAGNLTSLLPSGHASRVLIVSVLVNPVDAIRTGALLATSGTTAFGAASLAFLRFTKGTTGAAIALTASVIVWTLFPALLATWRLRKRDL